MSILVDRNTRLITQGITGDAGRFHTLACRKYGTNVVGGVTPGRGGSRVARIPVYDTVREAVEKTGANATMIFVPAPFAADAVLEAAEAGIEVITCITEGIPALDEVRMKPLVRAAGARLIGPNCPGVISPGAGVKVGIMPGYIHAPGHVGVVSRSGTLTYEAVWQLTELGLGQSTCVGMGGDPVPGQTFVDLLRLFEEDPETEAVLMIGEIGGTAEEEAAAFITESMTKPVAAFISGATAPAGKRMGHAGAIISGGKGTAAEKKAALRAVGVEVADSPAEMARALASVLGSRRVRAGGRRKTVRKKATAGHASRAQAASRKKATRKKATRKTASRKTATRKTATRKTASRKTAKPTAKRRRRTR